MSSERAVAHARPVPRRVGRGLGVGVLTAAYHLFGPIGRCVRRWAWTASVRARARHVGPSVYVYGPVYFLGTGNVRLGESGNIHDNVLFETEEDGSIVVGRNFTLNRGTVLSAHTGITIGDDALVGEFVSIRDSAHAIGDPSKPIRKQGFDVAPVRIGHDVWIGRGAVILKGVTIGDGAVIGANSVVTKNVPAGEIWVGVPARFLRSRGPAGNP